MIDLPRAAAPALIAVLAISTIVAACGTTAGEPSAPASAEPAMATSSPSSTPAAPSEAPAAPGGVLDPATPTACLTLGDLDCATARDMAASVLAAGDPPARYVQVGPFGCAAGDRCPTTLVARPEGDVVIELDGGEGINVHVKVAPDGSFEATREPAMGIAVAPTSAPGLAAGAMPFTLGHCGVFSGIDLDASWWDPVGPVPMDSGDAVNATAGVITVRDPNHASFTAPTGFALQLQRRAGSKLLPFCM